MPTGLALKIAPETLRSIDSATFTGAYQAVGTPLLHTARVVIFTNGSLVPVTVSWDGINPHEHVLAGESVPLNVTSNHGIEGRFEVPLGTQFYVLGTASTGLFTISVYYAY